MTLIGGDASALRGGAVAGRGPRDHRRRLSPLGVPVSDSQLHFHVVVVVQLWLHGGVGTKGIGVGIHLEITKLKTIEIVSAKLKHGSRTRRSRCLQCRACQDRP